MNKTVLSIIIVFLVVGGLLVFQATRSGTALVLLPSKLLEAGKSDRLQRIRVAGRVSADTISYQLAPEMKLAFRIEDPEHPTGTVPVVYRGLKPDMFAPGRDVIIDGAYTDGVLVASKLLTQCPSKYEPPKPNEADYYAAQGSQSAQPEIGVP